MLKLNYKLKYLKQRGQAIVMYALMLPILFTFVGAAADFGWWYFNESRLQNAADAAALAGANQIVASVADEKIRNNLSVVFINKVDSTAEVTDKPTSKVSEEAKKYAKNNLTGEEFTNNEDYFKDYSYGDKVNYNPLYYVVELKGKANHLFSIMEKFGNMDTKAVAITKIAQVNIIMDEDKDTLERLKVGNVIIGNWEVQNEYHSNKENFKKKYGNIYDVEGIFDGKWNHYKTPNKKITNSGKIFGEENLSIAPGSKNEFDTPANGYKKYDWKELESINIDFSQDVKFKLKNGKSYFTEDWDIGYPEPTEEIYSIEILNNGSKTVRTHSQINFDEPYKTRPDKEYPDVLWARIESEPMWSKLGVKNMLELNTVRQIILNMNASNMSEEYRPICIFYDGPETNSNNPNLTEAERASVKNPRQSQPVILNLNADFSGILYMPNSPVVINGNGHQFNGFIVAKKYLSLKTDSDFYIDNGKYYDSSSKNKEYFKITDSKNSNNDMFVDSIGNVQYKSSTIGLKYGDYDAFGISEFTNHDYQVQSQSKNNLFTVGS